MRTIIQRVAKERHEMIEDGISSLSLSAGFRIWQLICSNTCKVEHGDTYVRDKELKSTVFSFSLLICLKVGIKVLY